MLLAMVIEKPKNSILCSLAPNYKRIASVLIALAAMALAPAALAIEVEVKGLFSGQAILVIDGRQKLLKSGASYAGVTLISADSKSAVVEIDGKRQRLNMSKKISSTYRQAERQEVRLAQSGGGHYVTPARINNRPVTVMVDTGATAVAMSLPQAKKLGIDYRNGRRTSVSTANGIVSSYLVTLDKVSVGSVEVNNVEALINMSDFPDIILLGNSYLSRVKMYRENGLLVLQSHY